MNADQIVALIDQHGWHEPTEYGRRMGLYCHCGKYCPGGVVRGKHITAKAMWRRHVKATVTRRLKEPA